MTTLDNRLSYFLGKILNVFDEKDDSLLVAILDYHVFQKKRLEIIKDEYCEELLPVSYALIYILLRDKLFFLSPMIALGDSDLTTLVEYICERFVEDNSNKVNVATTNKLTY